VETSAKCVSVVPADYRERLKNSVQFSSVRVQQNPAHSGRSQAGSWNGMRSQMYFEEKAIEMCSSSLRDSPVSTTAILLLQNRLGVASNSRSAH